MIAILIKESESHTKCREFEFNTKLKRFKYYNNKTASIQESDTSDHITHENELNELPIIDPLISTSALLQCKRDSPDNKDRISLGGSSSVGELQWENEINGSEFNGNGNELEWDNFEYENSAFQNEAEQLICEIEELTQSALREMR